MSYTDDRADQGRLLVFPIMHASVRVDDRGAEQTDTAILPTDEDATHPIDQLALDFVRLAALIRHGGDEDEREHYRKRIERALDRHITERVRHLLADAFRD